jgi:hypothetical protein
MTTRREFVTNALVGIGLLESLLRSEKVLAKSSRKTGRIGLQLYTVRKELEKDFESTLRKVAAIGYREVEFAGYYNRTSFQVKQTLNNAGLTSPSTHVSRQTIAYDLGSLDLLKQEHGTTAVTLGAQYRPPPFVS